MAFPICTPSFFKELVDVTKPMSEYDSFADILVSPAAVEYVLHLNNPDVVRKLMSIEDKLSYKMTYLDDENSAQFKETSEKIVANNPVAGYYWQIRSLVMAILQDKEVIFEKRMLILNYALKTIQGMIDKGQHILIPQFAAQFVEKHDYDKVLEYFKGVGPSLKYALSDGISLLRTLNKSVPPYKEIMNKIYFNLGVSGPETLAMVDMKKYTELRKAFTLDFMEKHSNWIENIMINYVWTYSFPFTIAERLNIWDNYVFFCSLYNAIKILITCYMPGKSDEDFALAISAFDTELGHSGSEIVRKMVAAVKYAGQANNGDMAILVLS